MSVDGEVGSAGREAWLERCPECGYDLRGTDLDAMPCPECGWEATPEQRERLRRLPTFDARLARCVGPVFGFGALVFLVFPVLINLWVALGACGLVGIAALAGVVAAAPVERGGGSRTRARRIWLVSAPWLFLPMPWTLVTAIGGEAALPSLVVGVVGLLVSIAGCVVQTVLLSRFAGLRWPRASVLVLVIAGGIVFVGAALPVVGAVVMEVLDS